MLAHISTERTRVAREGKKSWAYDFPIVEPVVHRAISEFLGGLPRDYKEVCTRWVREWSPASTILMDLGTLLDPL